MSFYLSGATVYCIFLVYRMFQDRECNKSDPVAWTVIAIASLFWIVVIPLSIIEIRTKVKAKATANDANTLQQAENELEGSNSPITEH